MRFSVLAWLILLGISISFSGCIGGGASTGFPDDTSSVPPPQPTDGAPPSQADLGSAAMPSGTIAAAFESGRVVAGSTNNILVNFPPGYPAIASVQVGISMGAAEPILGQVRTTPLRPGTYRTSLTLPHLLQPGHHIFLRVVHVDGSVVESGIEDYLLKF